MRRPLWLFFALILGVACDKATLEPLPLDVTLSASKTAAVPGETINFTANARGGNLIGLQMDYADTSAGDQYGTSGARTQEIADEAGVNKALLHYYFRSKEKLAEAVFLRVARELLPPVIEVLASDAEIEDKVRSVVHREIDLLSKSPYLPGYLISEVSHHPERARQLITSITGLPPEQIRSRVFATLARQIDARVKAGKMKEIAVETFVMNLLALAIYPFAVRPMLMTMFGLDDRGFARLMARRRQDLAPFFLGALGR